MSRWPSMEANATGSRSKETRRRFWRQKSRTLGNWGVWSPERVVVAVRVRSQMHVTRAWLVRAADRSSTFHSTWSKWNGLCTCQLEAGGCGRGLPAAEQSSGRQEAAPPSGKRPSPAAPGPSRPHLSVMVGSGCDPQLSAFESSSPQAHPHLSVPVGSGVTPSVPAAATGEAVLMVMPAIVMGPKPGV